MNPTKRPPLAVEKLGAKLKAFRAAHGFTLRDVQAAIGVPNATLCRIENGKPVDYETGKQVEAYIAEFREPREWVLSGYPHACASNYVHKPILGPELAAGEIVTVREILPAKERRK